MVPEHDVPLRSARRVLAQEVLACLKELRLPVRGSVPYLADLLDSEDEDVVLGALEYLREARLAEAGRYVRTLMARPSLSLRVRSAASDALASLAPRRTGS
jgi:HEAT repeat protein